ncbi:unnamed protein product [Allacma fusca]|uniref:long-chain-fatty-acid--CoA ligase n=1 Tax=Allacma fusca TaxID=39272 RepID=A0A8J2K0R0_9HEXA|nr:unnamed protein product [Allacma fusca]
MPNNCCLNCFTGSRKEDSEDGEFEKEAFIASNNNSGKTKPVIQRSNLGTGEVSTKYQSFLLPGDERIRVSLDSADKSENYEKYFSAFDDVKTLFDPLRRGMKESNNGKCLGWIPEKENTYHWLSYKSVIARSLNFGRGLRHLGHKEKEFIGIYCENRVEWVLAEQGLFSFSMISVPLYDTLGPNGCHFIISQADVATVIVGDDRNLGSLFKNFPSCLKTIIHVEELSPEVQKQASSLGLKLHKFDKVEKVGKDRKMSYNEQPPQPEDIATLTYTSGTTGDPKGVIITHGNLIASVSATLSIITKSGYSLNSGEVIISYLPLAHIYVRMVQTVGLMIGCSIGFYNGKVDKILEAIQSLQPTILPCVPHVLNEIYNKSIATSSDSRLQSFLLRKAVAEKSKEIERGIFRRDSVWDKIVFHKIQTALGGRVRLVLSGGAPISSEILKFFRCALGCPVIEGYGQTETSGLAAQTLSLESISGHVGPPLPCCAIKLMDVPELNYSAKDGIGEICVKGPNVFSGYYKDPVDTFEVFDMDGWMHTGDVGIWLSNGVLKVLHRRNHVFKIKSGKIIKPEKIETICCLSPYVAQIFVHGDQKEEFLVGIVVPSQVHLTLSFPNEDLQKLCSKPEIKAKIFESLSGLAKEHKLQGFEQVKDIYLHPNEFSVEEGLLTPTLKSIRPALKAFFAPQIQQMFSKSVTKA